uniref:Uncharacterized protein n=1 Tax=Candidatus Methanogaster sp. ANME-2c ERB4 TaxID=2759911 RepID=A0A7G9YJ46_9EURY|nr:hypothetical protein CAKHPDBP_00001 [Methanosarcinales archaeon ANME-2c ERB4]
MEVEDIAQFCVGFYLHNIIHSVLQVQIILHIGGHPV